MRAERLLCDSAQGEADELEVDRTISDNQLDRYRQLAELDSL